MAIKRFAYRDLSTGWCLTSGPVPDDGSLPPPVEFGPVNLLVGPSGAGKSRVLEALQDVARSAQLELGHFGPSGPREWSITIDVDEEPLIWAARTMSVPRTPGEDASGLLFELERVEDAAGRVLAERTGDNESRLGDQKTPRLKREESLLALLADEPTIAPIQEVFRRMVPVDSAYVISYIPESFDPSVVLDLASLRSMQLSPLITKAWIAQEQFPDLFGEVVEQFRSIFGTIEGVEVRRGPPRFLRGRAEEPSTSLGFVVKEEGVPCDLDFISLSAGMQRTLKFLFQLALAPRGSVLLIDEVENSLGVNCLDGVVDHLLNSGRDIQLIMTSHHPYVINNIPRENWQVVTRKGSTVTLRPASAFPRLAGRSNQGAFIQLINTPEFEHGIQ